MVNGSQQLFLGGPATFRDHLIVIRLYFLASFLLLPALNCSQHQARSFIFLKNGDGVAIRWAPSRFPLEIGFSYIGKAEKTIGVFEAECRKQLLMLSGEFNRVAGRPLFRIANGPSTHTNIYIISSDKSSGKTTIHTTPSGAIRSAHLLIPCWLRPEHLRGLIAHELLHALGFNHDPARLSELRVSLRYKNRLPENLGKELESLWPPREGHRNNLKQTVASLVRDRPNHSKQRF